MRLSIFLISLTAPRAAAFQSPQPPRPALQLHSTPPDDGTFGSDGPMMAADPDAEFAALEAMAQANAAPAAPPAAPAAAAAAPEPQSYAEAEALALELCAVAAAAGGVGGSPGDEGEARRLYGEAVALFEQALKLPGDDYDVRRVSAQNSPVGGAPVLRDLERVTFPSVLQRQTAHYNIACCRAKLNQQVEALDALETALSLGFDDFQLVQREGDFSAIRGDVDRLVQRFKPKGLFKDVKHVMGNFSVGLPMSTEKNAKDLSMAETVRLFRSIGDKWRDPAQAAEHEREKKEILAKMEQA